MSKVKNVFVCQECAYEAPKWLGKCPSCNNWNTMVEEAKDTGFKRAVTMSNSIAPRSIMDITSSEHQRFDTGIQELNRVLGGGLVRGSLTLISGDPGIVIYT